MVEPGLHLNVIKTKLIHEAVAVEPWRRNRHYNRTMLRPTYILVAMMAQLLQFTNSQVFCTDVCFYSKQSGDLVEFRIEAPTKYAWVAIGLGTGMSRAEVFLGQLDNGLATISQRASTGYSLPQPVAKQDLVLVKEKSGVIGGSQVYTFTRPALATEAGGVKVSITSSSQSLIWAVGSSSSGGGAKISKHSQVGRASGNLLAATSAFTGQNATFSETKTLISNDVMMKIHGWTMAFSWMVLAPLAVASARFGKVILGNKWFRVHWGLMGSALILTIIGFFFVVAKVGASGNAHFNPSNYTSGVGGFHVIVGLMIFILTIVQVVSGYLIDKWFRADRKTIPISDKIHWWLGRTLFTSAIVNVMLGLYLYASTGESETSTLFYLSIAWTVLIVVLFTFFQFRFGQTHDAAEEKIALESYVRM